MVHAEGYVRTTAEKKRRGARRPLCMLRQQSGGGAHEDAHHGTRTPASRDTQSCSASESRRHCAGWGRVPARAHSRPTTLRQRCAAEKPALRCRASTATAEGCMGSAKRSAKRAAKEASNFGIPRGTGRQSARNLPCITPTLTHHTTNTPVHIPPARLAHAGRRPRPPSHSQLSRSTSKVAVGVGCSISLRWCSPLPAGAWRGGREGAGVTRGEGRGAAARGSRVWGGAPSSSA